MERLTNSDLARELAARRKRDDRPCEWCGAIMKDVIARRRYCTTHCHDQAAYARKKDRREQESP